MILRLICLCIFLQLSSVCYSDDADSLFHVSAQSDVSSEEPSPLESVLPQSPQAAALARYGEYPVGHTTGVPEISIPIYEIKLGDYTLPISISYHASGIKVDDVASTVGLGWSLNAGGVITRSVFGTPDLKDFDMDKSNILYYSPEKFSAMVESAWENGSMGTTILGEITEKGSESLYDTESDRYTYVLGNKSGVFRYNKEKGCFVTLDYDPILIYAKGGQESYFKVTDTDGIVYTFSARERIGLADDENNPYVSAWYLTEVETPWGKIELEYEYGGACSLFIPSETLRVGDFAFGECNAADFIRCGRHFISFSQYTYRLQLLKNIRWNGNVVCFTYSKDRSDICVDRLTNIQVTGCDGNVYKTVSFNNETYLGNMPSNKRMLLSSLSMSDEGTYSFLYNNRELPSYLNLENLQDARCHSDYWGYYNGRSSKCFIPLPLIESEPCLHAYYIYAADRNPDPLYSQAGILTSITYPTGGSTFFEYEQNALDNGQYVGGLRIRKVKNYDSDGTQLTAKTYNYYSARSASDSPLLYMSRNTDHVYYYEFVHTNSHVTFTDYLSEPVFPSVTGSSPVYYSTITETNLDGSIVDYVYDTDFVSDYCGHANGETPPQLIYSALHDYGGQSPQLKSVSYYDPAAPVTVIRHEEYSYTNTELYSFDVGVRIGPPVTHSCLCYPTSAFSYVCVPYVQYATSRAYVRKQMLSCKTVTDCQTGVSSVEEYLYDDSLRTILPVIKTVSGSDGKNYSTVYTYPFQQTDPICNAMTARNILDRAVCISSRCNGTTIKNVSRTFMQSNGWFFPERETVSINGKTPYETFHITDYDNHGNPLSIVENKTDTTMLVWGYNSSCPVMVLSGVSSDFLAVNSQLISTINTSVSSSNIRLHTELLKSAAGGSALVSSYLYSPLHGLTSETSPNGYTKNYSYGSDGMLSEVFDKYGTINKYSRHYMNPASGSLTESFLDNRMETSTWLDALGAQKNLSIQFYDGIGRPDILACNNTNTAGLYVYTMQTYDCKGRETATWLPLVGSSILERLSNSDFIRKSSSTYSDDFAFTQTYYDALDRIVSSMLPGKTWHSLGKTTTKHYVTNAALSVKLYTAPMSSTSLIQTGSYPASTLYGEKTTDEDGHTVTVFTDKLGRKVLERRDDGNDTYFVYNDLGQLRYVLSPEYQNAGYKAEYAYEYRYDDRGNVVKKILPGCEYVQYWYDRSDRMTFMQDATLRERGLYRFFLYDRLGRVAVQGTCTDCHRGETINRVSFSASASGFCNTGYTVPHTDYITNPSIETVNYYDTHDFISLYSGRISGTVSRLTVSSDVCTTGLQTGTFMYAGNGEPLIEAVYYDDKGRVTDTRSVSLGGRCSSTQMSYTYSGEVASSSQTDISVSGGILLSASLSNGYSSSGGLPVSADLTVGCAGQTGTSRRIRSLTYDSLGRVIKDTRSGSGGSVTNSYDLHGWLTGITGPGFTESLYYADGVGTPYYNGNISSMSWTTSDYSRVRGYKFSYDGLNRLTFAEYGEHATMDTNPNRYDEKVIEYNANGGIKRFQRRGLKDDNVYGKIDNLHIQLDGNRLQKVTDDALPLYRSGASDFVDGVDNDVEYIYNGAGALTSDANRGIANIEYDNLNHPQRVTFTNGNTIKYVYAPDGTKLRTIWLTAVDNIIVPVGSDYELSRNQILYADSTDYVGNAVYHNGNVDKYLFDGGYCSFENSTPVFHYYTKDHLGNNRVVTNDNGTTEQITHYYPFGGIITDISTNPSLQPYKYNGKELDRMHGWDKYDYGARMYDPILTVWITVDPLAEKYYDVSPYAYCGNNPVNAIDPDGRSIWTKIVKAGVKIGAKVAKNGFKELGKATAYADAVSDITDNVNTLFDNNASTLDKIGAGVSLASEFLPVSVGDVKDAEKIFSFKTSKVARREVMRKQKIPTSQQPVSQSKNASGREYFYESYDGEGKKIIKSVQQQTKDVSHPNEKHWEAGEVKTDDWGNIEKNRYGRAKLKNSKDKEYYE